MEIFEFIRSRLADEENRYPGETAATIVGTALSGIIIYEASVEDRRKRHGLPARTDQELMIAALTYLDQHWTKEMAKARDIVEARSIRLLEDKLRKALEFAQEDAEAKSHPIWFAIWTGIAANTAWLLSGALVLFLILLWTGNSLDDAVQKLLN